MKAVDFLLQGKGGVGKSLVASLLCQSYQHLGKSVVAFDTDPVNATLSAFSAFKVTRLEIMDGDNIDPRKFDSLLEELLTAPEERIIVDNGASSFIALCSYMAESGLIGELQRRNYAVRLHTVITGGQAYRDTLIGFYKLVGGFPNAEITVWLNPYFGRIDNFQDSEDFLNAQQQGTIRNLIELPYSNPATTGKDLEQLYREHKTFEEGIKNSSYGVQMRLRRYWESILACIEAAKLA